MRFAINEAVKIAIHILKQKDSKRRAYATDCSLYPNNITVLQDASDETYIDQVFKLLLRFTATNEKPSDQHLEWQIKQLYRVLNAACSSVNKTLDPSRKELNRLRNDVESTEQIQNWLKIQEKQRLEIICVGHGDCNIEHGHVANYHGCEIYCYSPIGTMIGYKFATAIENGTFNANDIFIEEEKTKLKFIPETYSYPVVHSDQNLQACSDFILTSAGKFKSRIIEKCTSRVLLEPEAPIKLSEIAKRFPNAKIHWAACASVGTLFDEEIFLTPNGSYSVDLRTPEEDHLPSEAHYRKLRRTTVKFKYDADFTLFASNRNRTLNPDVEEELKRKLPHM